MERCILWRHHSIWTSIIGEPALKEKSKTTFEGSVHGEVIRVSDTGYQVSPKATPTK